MTTNAKVIQDSISADGTRLTTFEITLHRFVLAEFNTHRVISKNSASSRAIPLQKQLDKVSSTPAVPLSFPVEQKGMQGGEESDLAETASWVWKKASLEAWIKAAELGRIGIHKSVANRLLEPFMWHTIVCTATAWENFFAQRCSPLAQPEIRAVADLMREAYDNSTPTFVGDGDWHLPYLDRSEVDSPWTAVKVSAARCARVSYLTHDGKRDVEADLALYERLVRAQPPHWSPLEHVATPDSLNVQDYDYSFYSDLAGDDLNYPTSHLPIVGNLLRWRSLRTEVEAVQGILTYK